MCMANYSPKYLADINSLCFEKLHLSLKLSTHLRLIDFRGTNANLTDLNSSDNTGAVALTLGVWF